MNIPRFSLLTVAAIAFGNRRGGLRRKPLVQLRAGRRHERLERLRRLRLRKRRFGLERVGRHHQGGELAARHDPGRPGREDPLSLRGRQPEQEQLQRRLLSLWPPVDANGKATAR